MLLNDNRDSTFTEFCRQNDGNKSEDTRTIMVQSKNPLPLDAPPRAQPTASRHNPQAQIDLAASIAEWQNTNPAESLRQEPTVDEILARKAPSAAQAPSTNVQPSDALNLAGSHPSESEVTSAPDAIAGQAREVVDVESDVEPGAPEPMSPIAQENWAIIREFFTSKKFPPPQSGISKELMSLQRSRNIELNPLTRTKPYIQWPKDVSLLIVQMVGRESPTQCGRCSKGHGIFSSCVLVSQDVANVVQGGVCACVNCSWKSNHHRSCNLGKLLGTAELRKPAADAMDLDTHADSGASESDQPLRVRRFSRPILSDDSDGGQSLRPRHSRRLRRNSLDDGGRTRRNMAPMVSTTEGTATKVDAAVRQMTHFTVVDRSFSFRVDVVPPGTRLQLHSELDKLRICSLVTGKVAVKVHGEPKFDIGFQGMFRLLSGMEAEVLNSSGFDAILQISSFRER